MTKPGSMLHRRSAEVRGRKAMMEARMAMRDTAKAAAHAAADLAQAAREELLEHSAAERAGEAAHRKADEAMQRLGGWLASPPIGDRLGIVPRRRSYAGMAVGLAVGLAAGVAAAMVLQRRSRQDATPELGMDATWEQEQRIAPPLGDGQIDLAQREAAERIPTS